MEAWIFVHDPLERYLDNYKRTFDAWEAGGVRGIVIGYLRFIDENGQSLPTFHSDPAVYKSFGIAPPAEGPRDPKKEQKFQRYQLQNTYGISCLVLLQSTIYRDKLLLNQIGILSYKIIDGSF